jgi:hypothetical protein
VDRITGDWITWARNISIRCAPEGLIRVEGRHGVYLYLKTDQTRFYEKHGHEPICYSVATGEIRCWRGLGALMCKPIWIDEGEV